MNDEIIKINKLNKSITFINNGIVFSQFGVADEILDLITNLQKENERLNNRIDKAIEYIKSNYIDNPIEFKKDLLSILGGD